SAVLLLTTLAAAGAAQTQPPPARPSATDLHRIETTLRDLSNRIAALGAKRIDPALVADADVYRKAAEFILRFPEEFATEAFVADTLSVLDEGLARARDLDAGTPAWPKQKGHVIRAYVSRVDGSVQPYALTIPESYDGSKPVR